MCDFTHETRLAATEACRHPLVRHGGHPLNRSVLERWWTRGIRGPKGERIVLESRRIGGLRFTSVEAVERFLAALNGEHFDGEQTPSQAKRQHAAAERELEAAGI